MRTAEFGEGRQGEILAETQCDRSILVETRAVSLIADLSICRSR